MSSIFTHPFAGAAVAAMAEASPTAATVAVAALCAVIANADDISAISSDIPYGAIFGHRGLLHSLLFAPLFSATITLFFFRDTPVLHFVIFLAATARHGSIDAMTDGGLGIAFFSPFDTTRYFFPHRPPLVPPLGVRAFFTRYGLSVFISGVLWGWLPLGAALLLARGVRWIRG